MGPIEAWLAAWPDGPAAAAEAAARACATPWEAVRVAGRLARSTPVDGVPVVDANHKRAFGAWDTPEAMAQRLVGRTRTRTSALDPACGAGALLLALAEAGVRELHGVEVDPAAAAVARVVVPQARIQCADALEAQLPETDLVVANPPFVAPEAQDKSQRRALKARYPWLKGRWDLSIPMLARLQPEELALVCPTSALRQRYGRPLRERWMRHYRRVHLAVDERFPGAAVKVNLLVLRRGPDALSEALAELPACPIDPEIGVPEVGIARRMRSAASCIGDFCEVDTGVVSHGPLGGKAALLHDAPGAGRVPYVDAQDLARGRRRFLDYQPDLMHRAKRAELFDGPKLLVQRVGAWRVHADRTGLYAGHTLTVVRPLADCPYSLEQLQELLQSPLVQGLIRIEQGRRLDLYPRDIRGVPVPSDWPARTLHEAYGLEPSELTRLRQLTNA